MARWPAIVAWIFYDWACTAFGAVITTFIFSVYFTRSVATSEVEGTALWSHAVALAGITIALLSPILGAVADHSGRRKPWIAGFAVIAILATGSLWFVTPGPASIPLAMAGLIFGTIGVELGFVFYNAMLPGLAPPGWLGRVSGWGWAAGYLGGLGCLVLALFGLVQTEAPLFGLLTTADQANVRAVAPLVAIWYAVFALPMFLFTPDQPSAGVPLRQAVGAGLATLGRTLRQIRQYKDILRFLIASAFFRDGLTTLVTFGGIYAAGTFGMDFQEIVLFAIALNLAAAAGSIGFAWVDDRIGAKPTILMALAGLIGLGVPLLLITAKLWFWILAVGLGVFIGPAQAAGRSLLARMAPPGMVTEMFGLYSLSGKAVAFMGPLALGWATAAFNSQRAGMATIMVLFAIGFAIMLGVREPPRRPGLETAAEPRH